MRERPTDERKKLEAHQREFSERFAAWWNRGVEKARQSQAAPTTSKTTKRDAA